MDDIYVIIFIVIQISMFGAGFLVARQLRALENVPLFEYRIFILTPPRLPAMMKAL